ncbi:MAG: type II toxin-antitoxin system VapB family antitoxin [Acidimicrobiia bacterium]|nr:type II toxin-antitoxin system VapB family antitoxin [Acidimicrobiia bacterium]
MSRINIDIEDDLIARVMSDFGLPTNQETVHFALERLLASGQMSVEDQLEMEGVGWYGDLDEMRSDQFNDRDGCGG